ncbi:MAG TPA: hypothetical protein VHL58_08695 [Thermoanaerobaculia bacterium]|nr:hypothetical protein [Thermoanaerobaculia bacterium]
MRNVQKATASLLLCALVTSCATVSSGRYERIPVTSNPEGASVAVDCGKAARHAANRTPTTITVPRNATPCRVLLRLDGYETQSVALRRQSAADLRNFNVAAAGVVFLDSGGGDDDLGVAIGLVTMVGGVVWGGVGLAVDRATGAMFHHTPEKIRVALQPEAEAPEVP